VPSGSVIALMGPSGCGKSTTIALAAGLLPPTAGHVRRTGRRTAVMFQDPLLLPWRTALANVAFALKADRLGAAERRQRARDVLATVGLTGGDIHKYPRQLSGGMRQRVALARALVVEPDLLLLDEPFSGLDAGLTRQVLALVRTVVDKRGVAALVVTHDAREAARFAERVYVLSPAPARVVALREVAGGDARGAAEIEATAETILSDLGGSVALRAGE
jgi:NitT/TauT family transport system ATP-binding protein